VSDIPIGSPPVPPGRHAAPGGWYPDPVDAAQERYWDGWQWSRNTRPREASSRRAAPARSGDLGAERVIDGGPRPGSAPLPYGRAETRPVPRTSDGVPLAGWWWRVLAVVIDNMITSTLTAIVLGPIYLKLVRNVSDLVNAIVAAARAGQTTPPPAVTATELLSPREQLIVLVVSLTLQMLYLVGFWRWKAATPGKLVCGLRIVPFDHGRSSARLAWRAILIRAAIWVLPAAQSWLLPLKLIDALFPLLHPQRLAIHDLAARTQVVKVR
jgi:uncharacterized RDD family membrane protein YckC